MALLHLRIADFQKFRYEETYNKGKLHNFNITFAFSNPGNIEIEITRPLWGKSIYQDFLVTGRKGLHHLGFVVCGDFDQPVTAYTEMGFGDLMSGRGPNRAFAYLGTEELGGGSIELIQRGGPHKPIKQG